MTKFWGKLFGINFALGVPRAYHEFQFGTNWAYYSHYVGDIFRGPGWPSRGLMAFFLGPPSSVCSSFGWGSSQQVPAPGGHLVGGAGTNLSALWILVANGWMQNPVGAEFGFESMRMEMMSFADLVLNPVAQVKFVHTVAAGPIPGGRHVCAGYLLLTC